MGPFLTYILGIYVFRQPFIQARLSRVHEATNVLCSFLTDHKLYQTCRVSIVPIIHLNNGDPARG